MKLTPEIIRICRVNLNWTQGELGRRAQLSVPLLGAIERDERPMLPQVETRIRQALPLTDEEIAELVDVSQRVTTRAAKN